MAALGANGVGIGQARLDLSGDFRLEEIIPPNAQAVINAAAYTAVDKAESEEALARKINAEAPAKMALYCKERSIPFVHYSTDYVYSGEGTESWKETSLYSPLSAYGRTKLEGDLKIQETGGQYLIFRTSWVFDAHGKNFLNTMLRLGAEREELRVVADQYGSPSYAPDLAAATLQALSRPFTPGVYHMCNTGTTNWHEFATAIIENAKAGGKILKVKNIVPIKTSEYPTPARRPLNSRLDLTKLENSLGIKMPSWKDALGRCMEEKFAESREMRA